MKQETKKAYRDMTPAERTAQRIAENRKIDDRVSIRKEVNNGYETKRTDARVKKAVREVLANQPGGIGALVEEFLDTYPNARFGPVTFRRMSC